MDRLQWPPMTMQKMTPSLGGAPGHTRRDVAPLEASGRTAEAAVKRQSETASLPRSQSLAADSAPPFLPVIVVDVSPTAVVVARVMVIVILGQGEGAGQREGEGGNRTKARQSWFQWSFRGLWDSGMGGGVECGGIEKGHKPGFGFVRFSSP